MSSVESASGMQLAACWRHADAMREARDTAITTAASRTASARGRMRARRAVIAMAYEGPRVPRVYDESDLAWIAKLLDVVEESVGEPWRVLIERVEYAPLRVHAAHRAAMLQALRRVLGATLRTTGEHVESRRWT